MVMIRALECQHDGSFRCMTKAKEETNMADPEDEHGDKIKLHIPQGSKQTFGKRQEDRSKVVEVTADHEGDVSDISEEERNSTSSDHQKSRTKRKIKKKRRSKSLTSNDGDTSSSDEDVSAIIASNKGKKNNVNLNDLTWIMWVWYYITAVSMGTFHFAEYLGEKLADFFGITSPKYQYVIDEYYRMKREEEKEKEAAEREEEVIQQKKMETLSKLEVGAEAGNFDDDPELSKL